ncbi:MAG: PEP-CTERM sorting domain-containing protein [Sandarakinorhabdus sp.]|nr:PEP-CTERM sorting domain-containing protein [Sandarakinorhabdus sp.]
MPQIGSGNFVVATAASVPEPASWTLLIAGFGIVGVLLRQRRAGRLPIGPHSNQTVAPNNAPTPAVAAIAKAPHIDRSKFRTLRDRIGGKFGGFAGKIGLLGIGLRADRHIFTGRHRHRPCNKAGDSGQQNIAGLCGGRCNTDNQTGRRNNAVVGAKHGGAQPTYTENQMGFNVQAAHRQALSC